MKILKAMTRFFQKKQEEKTPKTDANKTEIDRFMTAAYYDQVEEVEKMLAQGFDVNSKNEYGNTALICAAKKGLTKMIERLLTAGADINFKNEKGMTALTYAAIQGHGWAVDKLVKAGADLNVQDNDGKTPLMYASNKGYAKGA